MWKWILGVPAGLFALTMIVGTANSDPARNSGRASIALCWQDHDRKSLSLGEKQFIASACEKMERDFRAKHDGATP